MSAGKLSAAQKSEIMSLAAVFVSSITTLVPTLRKARLGMLNSNTVLPIEAGGAVNDYFEGRLQPHTQSTCKFLLGFALVICVVQIICLATGQRFHSLQLGSLIPFFVVLLIVGHGAKSEHKTGAFFHYLAIVALLVYILSVMFTQQTCDDEDGKEDSTEPKPPSAINIVLYVFSGIFLGSILISHIVQKFFNGAGTGAVTGAKGQVNIEETDNTEV